MAVPQICTTDGELLFVDDPNHSPYRSSLSASPLQRISGLSGGEVRDTQRARRQLSLTLTQASDSPHECDAQTPQSLDSQQGGGVGKSPADVGAAGGVPTGDMLELGTAISNPANTSPLTSKRGTVEQLLHVSCDPSDRQRKHSWIQERFEALGQLWRRERAGTWCAMRNDQKLGFRVGGYSAVQIGSAVVGSEEHEVKSRPKEANHKRNGSILTGAATSEAEPDLNTHVISNGCVKENGSTFRSNTGDSVDVNAGGGGVGGGEGDQNEQPDLFSGLDRRERFQRKRSNSAAKIVRGTFRALSFRKRQRRLIFKDGTCNLSHKNIRKRKRHYLVDLFTTLVDIKWRFILLLFLLAFIASWTTFAIIWWIIVLIHGDIDENPPTHVPSPSMLAASAASAGASQTLAHGSSANATASASANGVTAALDVALEAERQRLMANEKRCLGQITGFGAALLFSIETQQTIGFGYRYLTDNCKPVTITILMLQSCCGVIIQALMTGIVFAKLSRSKKRALTLMFSKNAVICRRDGELCLLFRVGDMRKSHIIDARIRGILIQRRITREGEVLPLEQYNVDFGFQERRDQLFFIWPILVEHRIRDASSPFWDIGHAALARTHFELIVILEGIVEATGMTTQARTSYLPNEILWGHRFERLVTYEKENGAYQVDYSRFEETRSLPNFPPTSAAEQQRTREREHQQHDGELSIDHSESFDQFYDDVTETASVATGAMAGYWPQSPRQKICRTPCGSRPVITICRVHSSAAVDRAGVGLPERDRELEPCSAIPENVLAARRRSSPLISVAPPTPTPSPNLMHLARPKPSPLLLNYGPSSHSPSPYINTNSNANVNSAASAATANGNACTSNASGSNLLAKPRVRPRLSRIISESEHGDESPADQNDGDMMGRIEAERSPCSTKSFRLYALAPPAHSDESSSQLSSVVTHL